MYDKDYARKAIHAILKKKTYLKKSSFVMEIWLDTIDLDVIRNAADANLVAGVTTNPSILSHTKNVKKTLSQILDLQPGPLAVQVTSTSSQMMIEEGLSIFNFSPRTIVKIPLNYNGLIAIKALHQKNIPVLGTGILYPSQALLASHASASYIAPYFSHLDKIGNSQQILKEMVEMFQKCQSNTKILVASLKKLDQILYCASLGVHSITIKPELYYHLIANQPLVEEFTQKFSTEWELTHGKSSIKELLTKALVTI